MEATLSHVDKATGELKSVHFTGNIPSRTIEELISLKREAKEASSTYSEAIKAQAEKYGVEKKALNWFVTAREADKTEELRVAVKQLELMLS